MAVLNNISRAGIIAYSRVILITFSPLNSMLFQWQTSVPWTMAAVVLYVFQRRLARLAHAQMVWSYKGMNARVLEVGIMYLWYNQRLQLNTDIWNVCVHALVKQENARLISSMHLQNSESGIRNLESGSSSLSVCQPRLCRYSLKPYNCKH